MREIKKIKELISGQINICGYVFDVLYDEEECGASFTFERRRIVVGIKGNVYSDILNNYIHEISEAIHVCLNHRYTDHANDSYIFMFNHSGFQSHCDILVQTLISNKIINT